MVKSAEQILSSTEFKKRLKKLRANAPTLSDKIKLEDFESWEDIVELFKAYETAPEESLSRKDIRVAARANPPQQVSKSSSRRKNPTPISKPAKLSKPSKPARATAETVEPGISHGPPQRFISTRLIVPEPELSDCKFRRQRRGIGKCTGEKLKRVKSAFGNAYIMVEAAKLEVRLIQKRPDLAQVFWHGSVKFEEASLSYWFGEDYSDRKLANTLHEIEQILSEWSSAFRSGFRDVLPVFIRCKSKGPVSGNAPARHLVKNTIELMPRYFEMERAKQVITMMHEMGHRSTSLLRPRDERHTGICVGGWNKKKNMCYRDTSEVKKFRRLFKGGNPRLLAQAATRGDSSARKTALNNIDNYVCYIWNRYIDHSEYSLRLLAPDAKPAKLKPGASKPASS